MKGQLTCIANVRMSIPCAIASICKRHSAKRTYVVLKYNVSRSPICSENSRYTTSAVFWKNLASPFLESFEKMRFSTPQNISISDERVTRNTTLKR